MSGGVERVIREDGPYPIYAMRQMECFRLRVKDNDFGRRQIVIQQGRGGRIARFGLVDPHAIAEELVEVDRQRHQFRNPGETGCNKICYHPQHGSGLMHLSKAQFDCYVASPFLVGK